MIVFDIETGPLPEEQLRKLYKEPTLEDFAATCDKRWKPETVQQKFAEHIEKSWPEFVDRAALSPLTGRVLAIGYQSEKGFKVADSDESSIIEGFWGLYRSCLTKGVRMVGHNIFGFDLPFLIRRSWLLSITPPDSVFDGRYIDNRVFWDTMNQWKCGNYRDQFIRLDTLAKAFNCGEKPEDVDGSSFHELYHGTVEQRQQAIDYLKNDLEMSYGVAVAMGAI